MGKLGTTYRGADLAKHSDSVSFGRAGIKISQVGLGTAPLGGLFRSVEETTSDELIKTAISAGVNFFDTSPFYGHTRAEIRLGRGLALAGATNTAVVSTKVGRVFNPGEFSGPTIFQDREPLIPVFDYSPYGIRRSFEESLERMNLDQIDIALIHDPENHMDQAIDEAYPELEKIRDEGLVKSIGVGINFPDLANRFVKETNIDLLLIAGRFTLLDQSAGRELLPNALRRNVSILAAGVFNSGLLVDPNPGATFEYEPASSEMIDKARAIHKAIAPYEIPVAAVGLQFPLRHPAVKAILTGARDSAELISNLNNFDLELPVEVWQDLEDQELIQPIVL